jgi:hypothetical protein
MPPPPTPRAGLADRLKDEYKPMDKGVSMLSAAEALLRHPGRVLYEMQHANCARITLCLWGVALICLVAYGLTAGTFSCGRQVWAAPLKLTVGAFFSALICFPSLVIFSCLGGSTMTVGEAGRLLVGMLTLTALLLLGFAPVSWIFGQSTESVAFMGTLHIVFWAIGTYYGLRFLGAANLNMEGQRARHLRVWAVVFVAVSLQMSTALRPIIGSSDDLLPSQKKFFLVHWGDVLAGAE